MKYAITNEIHDGLPSGLLVKIVKDSTGVDCFCEVQVARHNEACGKFSANMRGNLHNCQGNVENGLGWNIPEEKLTSIEYHPFLGRSFKKSDGSMYQIAFKYKNSETFRVIDLKEKGIETPKTKNINPDRLIGDNMYHYGSDMSLSQLLKYFNNDPPVCFDNSVDSSVEVSSVYQDNRKSLLVEVDDTPEFDIFITKKKIKVFNED
jgi:hypothetical protein